MKEKNISVIENGKIEKNEQTPNDFLYILKKLIKSGKMIKKREN